MKHIDCFCTCRDKNCPLHPENQKEGCTPCIRKCLGKQELPSCFFNMVEDDVHEGGYTFEDFAAAVYRRRTGKKGEK